MTPEQLIALDQQYVWHPYASMDNPPPAYPVIGAQGVRLTLADGQELIDGMASWWCAVHGYNHPYLNQAMKLQIDDMSHVMFGGITHQPAVSLAKRLVDLTPPGLDKVFFADSGSVAVEVAIKMALQYWHSKAQANKNRMLTIRNGYHGDTFGAMAVCDPINGMHSLFASVLPQHYFVNAPPMGFDRALQDGDLTELEDKMRDHQNEIAALILEPIVQGAGGMRFYSPQWLKGAADLCKQYNILLIADEIATGFGRSGALFACDHAQVQPDIMCLGKAITGGTMSFAATLTTEEIATSISRGEASCFMHGPTFMANPLACAVANASLDLLEHSDWKGQVRGLNEGLNRLLQPAKLLVYVEDVRVLGAIGVIQVTQAVDLGIIQKMFVAEGIWVRPFGKLVYVMPPYVMSPEDLTLLCNGMLRVLARYFGEAHGQDCATE
ncbi:adenosylmethionine--8-amino-7-oxononanoate transaminase [Candidatus Njordibacter sp. Uisw_056]|jgi:adenosylmethionine-8-amino-7-oxononanoate aminotransferase|uniref:adenosylmethionine--8-amino-7-oxononanoate transaminase n=1 Tax=Candidatus Njordibacter sp. Uisw_056 TaxID=3230973 RepID=UPI003D38DC76|tara:strand:- start:4196 stop:5512 length:1317 start_codon:yes stop_codon:yes gene_type:complete